MLTAEQKDARRLGGSTIAAALGLSRWKTPLDAYLDIRKEAPDVEMSAPIERGTFLEPALRQWANHRLGTTFDEVPMPLVHPDNPWFTFSPDGLERNGGRILEIKSPGPHTSAEWGEPGTDQVPAEYHLQGDWGMAVANRNETVFAALIGGELRIYPVKRDLDLERVMLAKAAAFIEQHVIPGIPPPAVYGDDAALKILYPREADIPHLSWLSLDPSQQQTVADFLRLHAALSTTEREKESREVLVKDIIRTAPGIDGLPEELGYSRIDWKATKPALNAGSWKTLAEGFLSQLDEQAQREKKDGVMPKEGTRRFTPMKRKTP